MSKRDDLLSREEIIDLKEFMLQSSKNQEEKIRETLAKIYGEDVKITQKHIDKVLNVAFEKKDIQAYLPKRIMVDKVGNKIIFTVKKNSNLGLLILFLLAFMFIGGFATFTGVIYLNKAQLNIDLDGDGIADINIDLNNDGICDINCDTNKDKKPDQNIDYHGNRKPIFNILGDDGKIRNPINQDIDGDGICDINCDTNDDGWPDLNIDFDGDGKVDLDRDINGDGIKDLDLDINGDGVCDINCDDDKDNKCDRFCSNTEIKDNGNGTSSSVGEGGINATTANLIVMFDTANSIDATNIYPDDQEGEGVNTKIPDVGFTVENPSDVTLYYDIRWYDIYSTFESDNFWFKITSDNGGYNKDWNSIPKEDSYMVTKIAIAPKTKQTYTVSFTLHGTGSDQNYDQGKTFRGKLRVDLKEAKK